MRAYSWLAGKLGRLRVSKLAVRLEPVQLLANGWLSANGWDERKHLEKQWEFWLEMEWAGQVERWEILLETLWAYCLWAYW